MKKILLLSVLVATVLLGSNIANATPYWSFDIIPSDGTISGSGGSTIGWGYSITNLDQNDWLVISGLSANVFQNGAPTDIFDYPIIAPGTTLTVPYDGTVGLYQLTWDSAVPNGFVNSGMFTLSAEFWDGDPFINGNFLTYGDDQSVFYTATADNSTNPVPEPSTMLLLVSGGLTGVMIFRKTLA